MDQATTPFGMDRDQIDYELPREIDYEILELLSENRQTRQHLAAVLDVTGQYIYERVETLETLGLVRVIHNGFYELAIEAEPEPDVDSEPEPPRRPSRPDANEGLPAEMEQELERYRAQLERNNDGYIDERIAAARAVFETLVERGKIVRRHALDELRPAYGYGDFEPETWWDKAGKERFAKLDCVQWDQSEQAYVFKPENQGSG